MKILNVSSFIVLFILFFNSCISINGVGKIVKPDEAKHFRVKGVLVLLSVDKEYYNKMSSMMLIMKSGGADYNIFVNKDNNYILLDMPITSTGISKVGLITDTQSPDVWFNYMSTIKLDSNSVNYLGNFKFNFDPGSFGRDTLIVSSRYLEDKNIFFDIYPFLSNYQINVMQISNGDFVLR